MISHEAHVCRLCRPRHKRYAFATHAVHVEKIPVDIVGEWLKQRNLDVADYYSQPTEGMVADAADCYLARIAAHVQVGEAVRRSPTELRALYETARGKVGTLADVIGGHSVSHGFCAANFACVGCAGKAPDPAKRQQVERHRAWAQTRVTLATADGLYPEAERMKQLVRAVPAWLQQQVYAPRRQRTLDLVCHAVDALVTAQRAVSLAAIASTSKTLDPTCRGISTSAILGNPEARAHYERHRRWSGTRPPRPTPRAWADGTRPRVDAHRDVARARQRYRRWTKGLLIERLLAVERAYADQEDRWLRVNDELLAWQLRAAPARSDRAIVRADSTDIGGPHHGDESPVAHHGD